MSVDKAIGDFPNDKQSPLRSFKSVRASSCFITLSLKEKSLKNENLVIIYQ